MEKKRMTIVKGKVENRKWKEEKLRGKERRGPFSLSLSLPPSPLSLSLSLPPLSLSLSPPSLSLSLPLSLSLSLSLSLLTSKNKNKNKKLKFVLGLPKWKYSIGKKHFTLGKKSGKMTLPTQKKFPVTPLCKRITCHVYIMSFSP